MTNLFHCFHCESALQGRLIVAGVLLERVQFCIVKLDCCCIAYQSEIAVTAASPIFRSCTYQYYFCYIYFSSIYDGLADGLMIHTHTVDIHMQQLGVYLWTRTLNVTRFKQIEQDKLPLTGNTKSCDVCRQYHQYQNGQKGKNKKSDYLSILTTYQHL